MDIIGYILGYVDGEIAGYQWIIHPKHILKYPIHVTFSNQKLIRM